MYYSKNQLQLSHKNRKEFSKDLKNIYTSISEDVMLSELAFFEEKQTQKIRKQNQVLDDLSIYFEKRNLTLS